MLSQYFRFLTVGVIATAVHLLVFSLCMQFLSVTALTANGLAFLAAVLFSFFGHFRWTFAEGMRDRRGDRLGTRFLRFLVTALLGLGLNSLIAWFVVDLKGLPYYVALPPMAIVAPAVMFLLSRTWVFPQEQRTSR